MSQHTEVRIDEAIVTDFQARGVVKIPGLFADWVDVLRAGIDRNMANPSERERSVDPADGSPRFFQDLCCWQRIPEYRDFVIDGPAAPAAAALMQSKTARFFHDHVLVKEAGTTTLTPWHQDAPYYCVRGEQTASFWIPLDPVSRTVSIEYLAGSHRWDKFYKPTRFDGTALRPNQQFDELPDVDGHRDDFDIAGFEMEPGDAIAFSFKTVHGAPGNSARDRRRRVFAARWMGDDVVYADHGGMVSPPFPDIHLNDGDSLEVPEFPLIYDARG